MVAQRLPELPRADRARMIEGLRHIFGRADEFEQSR